MISIPPDDAFLHGGSGHRVGRLRHGGGRVHVRGAGGRTGPGEGRHADLGIAGTNDKAIIFKKGKIVRTIDAKDADKVFEEELKSL